MIDCGCGGCVECCASWLTAKVSAREFESIMKALVGADTSSTEIRRKERGE